MIETNGPTHEPNDDLIRQYVAGILAQDDAERFEEHYFACDDCWREVESISEIRTALAPPRTARSVPSWRWGSLAAAAAVGFALLGVWQWQSSRPDAPIYRDATGGGLSTRASRSGDSVVLSWTAPADARRYQVHLFKLDGEQVASVMTAAPSVSLQSSEIGSARQYRVLAMDELGATVADSGLHTLP